MRGSALQPKPPAPSKPRELLSLSSPHPTHTPGSAPRLASPHPRGSSGRQSPPGAVPAAKAELPPCRAGSRGPPWTTGTPAPPPGSSRWQPPCATCSSGQGCPHASFADSFRRHPPPAAFTFCNRGAVQRLGTPPERQKPPPSLHVRRAKDAAADWLRPPRGGVAEPDADWLRLYDGRRYGGRRSASGKGSSS